MKTDRPDKKPEPPRLRLPGFVREEEVGLGDLITHAAPQSAPGPAAAAVAVPRR